MTPDIITDKIRPFSAEDKGFLLTDSGRQTLAMLESAVIRHNNSTPGGKKSLVGLLSENDKTVFPILAVFSPERPGFLESICVLSGPNFSKVTPASISTNTERGGQRVLSVGDEKYPDQLLFDVRGGIRENSFEIAPPHCCHHPRGVFYWVVMDISMSAVSVDVRQRSIYGAIISSSGEGCYAKAG